MSDEGRHGHPLPFAPMCWECWADKARTLESQNQALQEALEELVEEMKHLVNHGGVGNHQAVFDKARNFLSPHGHTDENGDGYACTENHALSPTQETDPE